MNPDISPNGGSVCERRALDERFRARISANPEFTRKTVSYQGNRRAPGFRWMKYKEGFSQALVERLLDEFQPKNVLDPFAGIGTAPIIAAGRGMKATGIEIMPVGVSVGDGIATAANGLSKDEFQASTDALVASLESGDDVPDEYAFRHVRITQAAFPPETEAAIAKARHFISTIDEGAIRKLLDVACMTVLEDVSYTRKDGQYLRWDYRSGRNLRARVDLGEIAAFDHALNQRLSEMTQDMDALKRELGGGYPKLLTGSSLELLRTLPDAEFDMVITSPPYANRYDYTRTYALELAWLGYDQAGFSNLRQRMLSATVENKAQAGMAAERLSRVAPLARSCAWDVPRTGRRPRDAGYSQRTSFRVGQPPRHTPNRGLLLGNGGHRRRARPRRPTGRNRHHGQRQRSIPR